MKKESLSTRTVKTLLAVIIFAGIGTIIIGGAWLIGKQYKTVELVDQETKNCAREGESIGTCAGCIGKCCQGLKPMVNLKYNDKCVDLPAPGSSGVCSNCGNGICDGENNEDECNCPEDCGEIKIPDWAIYKSEKLGIMFNYQNWWVENSSEKDFKNVVVEQNNTIKSLGGDCSMTLFKKLKNETIEETIEKIIKKEGVDLEDCKISVTEEYKQIDNILASISLKENYEPSDDEIMAKIGNINSLEDLDVICKTTPECIWAKQNLIEEKTKTKCSQYAKCFGYKCGSHFIYQPNNSEEKFIYIQSMANTPTLWEHNSIEILKDESDTSDWQIYKNKELGFEVKCPSNYKVGARKNLIELEPNNYNKYCLITIGQRSSFKNILFADWHQKNMAGNQEFEIIKEDKNQIVKTVEADGIQTLTNYTYFTNDKTTIYLSCNKDKDNFIYNQILSSFKFIEK